MLFCVSCFVALAMRANFTDQGYLLTATAAKHCNFCHLMNTFEERTNLGMRARRQAVGVWGSCAA